MIVIDRFVDLCTRKSRRILSFYPRKEPESLSSHSCFDAGKDEIRMTVLQSNRDALLVAVPMIGLLFAGFFRLDELFGKPKKPVENRRQMTGWDKNGRPLCTDPDGKTSDPGRDDK